MLLLLFRTRLRYYRNYLRHHFDRVVWFEIGFIVFILLYLTGRSPADIGYSLDFLLKKDFSAKYAAQWIALLPVFYLIAEALAFITLRPTGEWRILGTLPIAQPTITNYHLLRHCGKTIGLLFIGTTPFFAGDNGVIEKLARCCFALGTLLALQLAGFKQAFSLRNTERTLPKRILHWLPTEAIILCILIFGVSQLQPLVADSSDKILFVWPAGWALASGLFYDLRRKYAPEVIESQPSLKSQTVQSTPAFNQPGFKRGITSAMIWRDLKFLRAEKRSVFILVVLATIIILLAGLAQSSAAEAYASSIVLEGIFGFMLINTLLVLFEHDLKTSALQRSLPVSASTYWKARWLLASGFMAAPVMGIVLVIPVFFKIEMGFVFFIGLGLILPGVFAAVYCNAGFGLFPNIKFCGVLLNILLGLMILFWFYMPLGTVILLAISVLWIRKSQRHFQFLEIG